MYMLQPNTRRMEVLGTQPSESWNGEAERSPDAMQLRTKKALLMARLQNCFGASLWRRAARVMVMVVYHMRSMARAWCVWGVVNSAEAPRSRRPY